MTDLPKHGEVWTKEFCGCGICRVGWSLGAGTYTIDTTTSFDWGTPHQIECGCLHPGATGPYLDSEGRWSGFDAVVDDSDKCVRLTALRPGEDRVLVVTGDHVCEHATQIMNEVVVSEELIVPVEQFPVTVRVRSVERKVDFDRTFTKGESVDVPYVADIMFVDAVVDDSFFDRKNPFDLGSPPRKRRRWWQVWR